MFFLNLLSGALGRSSGSSSSMKKVTPELERLSLIEQGYSFCMEKMLKAVIAETGPPAEIDLALFTAII